LIHAAYLALALAQEPSMDAGSLAHALDRLRGTARVLYVAAHPDDENTRLLAHLANARHVTAAYLSMTRGGGGQNLIGREQGELLDVIRTEELLAARRLDGARQKFTRMRDFGYSKGAEETFGLWGHDEALADVVWVIRTFQPDVVITRFSEEPPNHGHHTASAVLAREAALAAADPRRFPEQLAAGASIWQVTRVMRNLSTWRNEPPPPDALALDVGTYDARLGMSHGELAARSRSQHKSQGFGVSGERGRLTERFANLLGAAPEADVLDGVPLGWERFGEAGAPVARALDEAQAGLDRDQPERALPALLAAQRALAPLPDVPRVRDARLLLDQVIVAASGVFVRATSPSAAVVPGKPAKVAIEVIMRRPADLTLARVRLPGGSWLDVNAVLAVNEKKEVAGEIAVPADAPVSMPYWLAQPSLPGRNVVADARLVGEPKGPPPLAVTVELLRDGRTIAAEVPVEYAWTDPVEGERLRAVLVSPPATVTPAREAVLLQDGRGGTVVLRVRAAQDALEGEVVLPLPAGWRAEPARARVVLASVGEEATVRFAVQAPKGAAAATVAPAIEVGGKSWSIREAVIDYPHIPMQVVLQPAALRLVPITLTPPRGTIAYVQGSGDSVPDDLADLGVDVALLDDETLRAGELGRFRAIVVGIRAYNTRDVLRSVHDRLMRYVEEGGTLVVQYNTQSRVGPLASPIGPFPLEIGRGRVTDENAAMKLLAPEHELVTRPHLIGPADFEGWVQERGLYYAEKWDPRYVPLVAAADAGETPLEGGLLFARHGKGRYVYTGLSFFRQLPAGVPGAYRLFLNLIGE
jgi:LmbE family N-acetylglucosaminyl deacetylase